ncbi:MAG: type II toxin-antitoxin system RelE/ParE family toxin [Planctomycetes bacterium]|nr:type II toxin-antitoxin system RelE/ParE family toxin [Planctomycetota bacterium]
MRVLFRPEARDEAKEAARWYEHRVEGLGAEFRRALDAAVSAALRAPQEFPRVEGEVRRCLLRRFPYSLLFRVHGEVLLVVAVMHHRRRS